VSARHDIINKPEETEKREDKMKHTLYLILLLVLMVAIVAVTGCKSETSPPGDSDTGELKISPAPIHEVQVNIAESFPPQIFVYIQGGLADSCTEFNDLTDERSGNTIEITVTVKRPVDAMCAQVYGYFEKNVALGTDFNSGETYIIEVNDYKPVTFVMQ